MASRLKAVRPAAASRSTRSRLDSGWNSPTSTAPLRRPSIHASSGRPTVTSASAWASSSGSSATIRAPASSYALSSSEAPAPAPAWTSTSIPWPASRVTASGVRATRRSCSRRSVGTAIFIGAAILPSGAERGRQKRRSEGQHVRPGALALPLVALDLVQPPLGEGDLVPAVQQPLADVGVDRERHLALGRQGDHLPLQVDRRLGRREVEREVRLLDPVVEQELAKPGALDPLQELLGDDLVGVDVGPVEGGDGAGDDAHRLHATSSRTSVRWPVTAA